MSLITPGMSPFKGAIGLRAVAFFMMVGLLAGCGGSNTAASSSASGSTAVTATIGPAGGTVTGPDGVQVVIPDGALDQPTAITITRTSAGAPAALDAYPLVGNVYEFTPHDLLFNRPVIIRAPVPSGALGTSVFMASPGENWNLKDATVVGDIASWERNSFSWMYYGTGVCIIPMSMLNDPYWCVWDRSFARISADPIEAMTRTAPPVFQNGDVGAYRVDAPATLRFESHPSVAGNCSNVSVALKRRRFNETTLQWGPQEILQTQSPAMTAVGSRSNGIATFNLPFTDLDNGKNHFALVVSYDCPDVLRQGGTVVGWASTVRSHAMGDGMLVVGNITQPTVFSTISVTVSGLTGTGLVLHSGSDSLPLSTDGTFTFPTTIAAGLTYSVSILPQPSGQTCTLTNGTGPASGLAVNVLVTCVAGSTKTWQGAALLETIDQGDAFESQIAFDANGNALAVWSQPSSLGGKFKIWARRYVPSTGWGTVEQIQTTDNTLDYRTPQIAFDANGDAIVVFAGFHPDGSETWAARHTAASSSWGSVTQLTAIGGNPQIAIDSSGNAMAVWEAWNGGAYDIRARRYVAATGIWQVAQLIETSAGSASGPQIVFDTNGNAMAVWSQWDGSTRYNIRANLYVAGTGWGAVSSIDMGAANNSAERPQIASDAAGNIMAVWQQFDGTTTSIYSNRYSAGSWGSAVLVETSANFAEGSSIAMNGNGDAIVVWTEVDGGDVTSIWARRYVAGVGGIAARIDNLSVYTTGGSPQIAIDASGNAMAVWKQGSYIWANRYMAGTGWGAATLIDNTAAGGSSSSPQIAVDGNGNAVAVWSHSGVSGPNVWGNVFR